jgi:hypothetical protein
MRREPSLTFEGALWILGQHEHKTIERIDKLLGGVILGGGAVAGAVALGATPLAPLAAFGVVWGWIEQKGLAVDLLKSAVDAVSGKISRLRGLEKRELIAAAHSAIVVASVFESLRDHVGEEFYGQLKITDDEKKSLIDKLARDQRDIGGLYASEIPAPSAACGFEENVKRVTQWQTEYSFYLFSFIGGLAVAKKRKIVWSDVRDAAVERYRSRYLELAAKVPEFAIWTQLAEPAATRTAIREVGAEVAGGIGGLGDALRELNAEVMAGFNANREALNRVAALLSVGTLGTGGDGDSSAAGLGLGELSRLRQAVNRANAGFLSERIVQADWDRYPDGLVIPRVSEIYVNPRYKIAEFDDRTRPADERWWEEQGSHDDFDVFLARHVTSPEAVRRPLLLLGHPGAGKSLLTKVFAARLPTSEYTVVRVPLRRVSADAEIHHQIEEALDTATHQRIAWSDLAEQSGDTVRVVLLDGLDELLQASEHDRSRYLEDVMGFQEREAMQRRPVVAVVTSRTVVADRVRIPDGTTIVKLDPFNDDDIAEWLGRWKRANQVAIEGGRMGELTASAVQRQPELAQQPLLLLMLALYAADRTTPPLDDDTATAELYRRLLDEFARREAAKDLGLGHDPSPEELEQQAQDHLDRLAVAALGMFNRGRQDIGEEELGKDLEALEPRLMERSRPIAAGQRIIGQFFFVHAPEARTFSGQQRRGGQLQRAYEFLHATFGEYLVARRVMDELIKVARKASADRRGSMELHEDLLFALLSHQVLVTRRVTLDFASEIFLELAEEQKILGLKVVDELLKTYRNRPGMNRYVNYRPTPLDEVNRLACYSANLVALRIWLDPENKASLIDFMPDPDNALERWKSTVTLWKSALHSDALRSIFMQMELTDDHSCLIGRHGMRVAKITSRSESYSSSTLIEMGLARLAGDWPMERNLRIGSAVTDRSAYLLGDDSWVDLMSASLIPQIIGQRTPVLDVVPPAGTPDNAIEFIARLIFLYLRSEYADHSKDERLIQLLFKLPAVFKIDELALTTAVLSEPSLVNRFHQLQDRKIYGKYAAIARRELASNKLPTISRHRMSDEAIAAIREILVVPRMPLTAADPFSLRREPGPEDVGG